MAWPRMQWALTGCWAYFDGNDLKVTCSKILQTELQPMLRSALGKDHWHFTAQHMLRQRLGLKKFPTLVMRYVLGVFKDKPQVLAFLPPNKMSHLAQLYAYMPSKGREGGSPSAPRAGSHQYILVPMTYSRAIWIDHLVSQVFHKNTFLYSVPWYARVIWLNITKC